MRRQGNFVPLKFDTKQHSFDLIIWPIEMKKRVRENKLEKAKDTGTAVELNMG